MCHKSKSNHFLRLFLIFTEFVVRTTSHHCSSFSLIYFHSRSLPYDSNKPFFSCNRFLSFLRLPFLPSQLFPNPISASSNFFLRQFLLIFLSYSSWIPALWQITVFHCFHLAGKQNSDRSSCSFFYIFLLRFL